MLMKTDPNFLTCSRCLLGLSHGSPARGSDFVYVNKSRNVVHFCRHNERKKSVHLVNLAQVEQFGDCVLNLFQQS